MEAQDGPYATVASELIGTPFSRIRYLRETGSTNADGAELLGDDSAAGLSIVADHQRHGAGRKGRTWIDRAESALLVTTLLPTTLATRDLWAVPFWAALAARRALAECGIAVDLHWPNDLLIGDRKLAGILCISLIAGERAWAGCGIGINVTRFAGAEAIEPPAAFCSDVAAVERPALLRALLLAYDATLDDLANPQHVARGWERAAGLPGKRYRLQKDGMPEAFEATALALGTGGGLLVAHADGRRETVALADARALRAT